MLYFCARDGIIIWKSEVSTPTAYTLLKQINFVTQRSRLHPLSYIYIDGLHILK